MSQDKQTEKKPVKYDGQLFRNIGNEIRLVFRLLADKRVRWWLKLLPFASAIYFIFPDLMPGPVDDAVIIFVGIYTFIELAPPDIVDEHRQILAGTIPGTWRDPDLDEESEVIDSEFKDES